MPSYFRSTKHFTINTPLGVTGDYNSVKLGRKFIIIDTMDNFLNSGYAYSVGYRDAYLDVTHEPLKISDQAIVLIDSDKYDDIIKDESIASELESRRVIKFRGDEILAIDMVLSEMSILPSRIGMRYAFYDEEIHKILDSSIIELAEKNNLLLNKSHGGSLSPEGGHFSNYFDEKNHDRRKYFNDLAAFIREKCNIDFEFTFMNRVDDYVPRVYGEAEILYNIIKGVCAALPPPHDNLNLKGTNKYGTWIPGYARWKYAGNGASGAEASAEDAGDAGGAGEPRV